MAKLAFYSNSLSFENHSSRHLENLLTYFRFLQHLLLNRSDGLLHEIKGNVASFLSCLLKRKSLYFEQKNRYRYDLNLEP